jgi:FRG domain
MPIPSDWSQKLSAFVERWQSNPSSSDEYLGDQPFPEFVLTEQASSWEDLLRWLDELNDSWCFRGQSQSEWLLHTSLDRAVKKSLSSTNRSGYYHLQREAEGRELLFRFQQQAHRYVRHLPSDDDLSSWFALMQHHGVPTRFLDWTRSPYVATYFAMEEEPQGQNKRSAIWAIDLKWLKETAGALLVKWHDKRKTDYPRDLKGQSEYISKSLGDIDVPAIIQIDPLRTDERMAGQQGFFLCKLIHEATFNQILMSMMIHATMPNQPVVRKLEVPSSHRISFLKNLRSMNIHRASLFPGLDGFGQSLRLDLEIKVNGS